MKLLLTAILGFAMAGAAVAASESAKHDAANQPTAAARSHDTPKSGASAPAGGTRDWSQVDTNKDHSVSPEEMEKYLESNPGPLKAKK